MTHPLLAALDREPFDARDVATLLFVIRAGKILLIRKKRGLGAGKINGPGGKLDPGEAPLDAAVREVREELGVTPTDVRHRGELRFAFTDGYTLHGHVYSADGCDGEAVETDEAVPLWTPLEDIPYGEMWADDVLWLPRMLAGYRFDGRFVFDGDALLAHALRLDDPAEPLFAALRALGIDPHVRAHPPVFTVAQARQHRSEGERGVHVKNLFVRDRKGSAYLLTVREDRPVELKSVAKKLGASGGLSFGSPARLREHLAVEPGSVTPLAVFCDREQRVTLVLDEALRGCDLVHCHPLTSDRTVALEPDALVRFCTHTGHAPRWLAFDEP